MTNENSCETLLVFIKKKALLLQPCSANIFGTFSKQKWNLEFLRSLIVITGTARPLVSMVLLVGLSFAFFLSILIFLFSQVGHFNKIILAKYSNTKYQIPATWRRLCSYPRVCICTKTQSHATQPGHGCISYLGTRVPVHLLVVGIRIPTWVQFVTCTRCT